MKAGRLILTVGMSLIIAAGSTFQSTAADVDIILNNESTFQAVNNSYESAGAELRQKLRTRTSEFTITASYSLIQSKDDIDSIIASALSETGDSSEGDYIRWSLQSYSYATSNNTSLGGVNINFNVKYNTTAEQEAVVDSRVNELIKSLRLSSKNDYEKTVTVYNYLVSNVDYSDTEDSRTIFSAYGALIEGSAVCQGYAQLMYRILNEVGVSCRVIPGEGNGGNHAWNIVEIDGKYYYVDSTWDSSAAGDSYLFFLRGSDDMDDLAPQNSHAAKSWGDSESPLYREYFSGDFDVNYPVSTVRYAPTMLGDIDNDGQIDSSDASAILRAYAGLSTVGGSGMTNAQTWAADVFSCGRIDASCSSAVLSYYTYMSTGGKASLEDYLKYYK